MIPTQTMLLPLLERQLQQGPEERVIDHVAVDGDAEQRHQTVEEPVELVPPSAQVGDEVGKARRVEIPKTRSRALKNSPNMTGCRIDAMAYALISSQPSQTPAGGAVVSHNQVNAVPAEGRRLLITAKLIAVGIEASVTSKNTTGATARRSAR